MCLSAQRQGRRCLDSYPSFDSRSASGWRGRLRPLRSCRSGRPEATQHRWPATKQSMDEQGDKDRVRATRSATLEPSRSDPNDPSWSTNRKAGPSPSLSLPISSSRLSSVRTSRDPVSPFADLLKEARLRVPENADDMEPDLEVTLSLEPVVRDPSGVSTGGSETAVLNLERLPTRKVAPLQRSSAAAPVVDLDRPGAVDPRRPRARRVGPYRLGEVIGTGGMATVYRGVQPSLERPVAIKSLHLDYLRDHELVERFEREAASLAQLQHPNIVQILDVVAGPDGGRHIVMELVDGIDAFDLLEAVGPLPPKVVTLIALQTAAGLEHSHLHRIVHRDIKPANVFISKSGVVKLVDFGIAWDPTSADLTLAGLSLGTPAYMSPEQIHGERVDPRTDIFSLGVVLYELLVGEPPWPATKGRNVALDVLQRPVPPLGERCASASPELVRLVERCLGKSPKQRWTSARAFRTELEALAHAEGLFDPSWWLVRFLAEQGLLTRQEAERFAPRSDDASGLVPARALGPIAKAHIIALALIVAGAAITATSPVGGALPSERPSLSVQPQGGSP